MTLWELLFPRRHRNQSSPKAVKIGKNTYVSVPGREPPGRPVPPAGPRVVGHKSEPEPEQKEEE